MNRNAYNTCQTLINIDGINSMLEVSLRDLYDFKNHPFHVNDDEEMLELIQSVKEKGILTPPIVRPHSEGGYEIITGHRRNVCGIINYTRTDSGFVR